MTCEQQLVCLVKISVPCCQTLCSALTAVWVGVWLVGCAVHHWQTEMCSSLAQRRQERNSTKNECLSPGFHWKQIACSKLYKEGWN